MKNLIVTIVYFLITKLNIYQYDNTLIYQAGIDVLQFLYFVALFAVNLYLLTSTKKRPTLLICSTIFLILYSLILRILLEEIAEFFTPVQGIINFAKYAGKIYFIGLPFASFRILETQTKPPKNYIIFLRIILFSIITILLKKFFGLNGILYSLPFYEFISFCRIIFTHFIHNIKQGGFYGRFNNFK